MVYINIRKAIHCLIQNFADFTCSTNLADNIAIGELKTIHQNFVSHGIYSCVQMTSVYK